MQEKKVTNEELAGMIKRGFDGVDEKFKGVDEKLSKMDVKISDIDGRLKIVETKLDKALYREFQRIDRLEKWAEKVGTKVGVELEREDLAKI